MATFEEVKSYVEKKFMVHDSSSSEINIEIPLPNNRSQKVNLHKITERTGVEYLRMLSFVAPVDKIDPMSCLRFNGNFLGAHLAVANHNKQELLVMCETNLLSNLRLPELEINLIKLVKAADGLEAKLFSKDVY